MLVLLLYIMYVPFILPHTAQPLLTDRSLLPAPMNTYQAPLLFMARMKSTCQSRSLLCVSSFNSSFFTVVELCMLAQPPTHLPPTPSGGRERGWLAALTGGNSVFYGGTSLLLVLTTGVCVCLAIDDSGEVSAVLTVMNYCCV